MNKENLKRLITVIEKSETFSMHTSKWGAHPRDKEFGEHPCGTAACIFGHIQYLCGETLEIFLDVSPQQDMEIAIPRKKYAHFMARPGQKGHITKSHAVRMLKKLLETGEVDWKGTKNPPRFDMKTWLSELQVEEENMEKINV